MANPTLDKLDKIDFGRELAKEGGMTVHGTALKTGVLLALAFVTGALAWRWIQQDPSWAMPLTLGGGLLGLLFAVIGTFFPKSAPVTAPLYALCKGCFLGAISLLISALVAKKTGSDPTKATLVLQATLLTFGVMAGMLALYGFRIIKVTGKLVGVIMAATIAIGLFYLVMFFVRMFSGNTSFTIFDSSWLSIGLSAAAILIAAFNLLLNFDLIEKKSHAGMPKYMEWFAALGLMVTLVWLYLEILQLLAKLNSRD